MSTKYDSMGKTELRAACKAAGIVYGKFNNADMRNALALKDNAQLPPVKIEEVQAKVEAVKTAAKVKELVKGPREHSAGYSGKGLRIEKGREESNGVKRPSAGGICRAIWDALDAKHASLQEAVEGDEEAGESEVSAVPTFKDLKDLMVQHGWARNTAMTQFQRWKQFNGLMARAE